MSVLNRIQIEARILHESTPKKRITVTPLLDMEGQLGGNSLDVRLGCYFITHRRANIESIDPQKDALEEQRVEIQEDTYVPVGEHFVLHPRQFAVGSTLEYIALPCNLTAQVIGKSSWGRQGLVIATAIGIHAWYRGVIVLELANVGEVPLLLYPGMRIAHLFFYDTDELDISAADISGYIGSTRPDTGRITLDSEIRQLGRLREGM